MKSSYADRREEQLAQWGNGLLIRAPVECESQRLALRRVLGDLLSPWSRWANQWDFVGQGNGELPWPSSAHPVEPDRHANSRGRIIQAALPRH
jgi:hypothetical protein